MLTVIFDISKEILLFVDMIMILWLFFFFTS